MKHVVAAILVLAASAAPAWAQDQQLGARTKAMGGSYTAFEDDPVSVWLNPAGIATQPDAMSISYQTYVGYPVDQNRGPADTVEFSVEAETVLVDPAMFPSYFGMVFQVGDAESPLAVGLCVARPYHLNYALDQVTDPAQVVFVPENNVEEGFLRFRVALAKDFRFKPLGESGWFGHLAVGLAVDLANESWEFSGTSADVSDTATSLGFGFGLLVGLYDNTETIKVNLGFAYQSAIHFDFSIEPDILPAFDMPEQFNAGITFYLLKGTPLRVTVDFQFIRWSETAEDPLIAGQPGFEDVTNISLGAEYRIPVSQRLTLFPRFGVRLFDAPWEDEDDLPMTGAYKLVLDTKGEAFTIFTLGAGLSWTTEGGKGRSVDLGFDVGGDATTAAIGYNHEF